MQELLTLVESATVVVVLGYLTVARILSLKQEARIRSVQEAQLRSERLETELSSVKTRLEVKEREVVDLNQQLKERDWSYCNYEELLRQLGEEKRLGAEAHDRLDRLLRAAEGEEGLGKLKPIREIGTLGTFARRRAQGLANRFREASVAMKWHILSALDQIERPASLRQWPPDMREGSPLASLVRQEAITDRDVGIRSYAAFLATKYRISNMASELQERIRNDESVSVVRNCTLALSEMGVEVSHTRPDLNRPQPLFGYVLVKAPDAIEYFGHLRRYYEREREPRILEASVVEGPYDLLVKVVAMTEPDFDGLIMTMLQSLPWVEYTRTFRVIGMPGYLHWFRNIDAFSNNQEPVSWVFAKVPSPQSGGVVTCALEVPEVTEAAAVFGDYDVVLRVMARDEQNRIEAMTRIRQIPYADDTLTLRELREKRGSLYLRGKEAAQLVKSGWPTDYLRP